MDEYPPGEKMTQSRNSSTVRIGTWNTEWARPTAPKGKLVMAALAAPGCDVLCVTEGVAGIVSGQGNVIEGGEDWGDPVRDSRPRVLLWSARPWTEVDRVGSERMPGGRFVRGVTQTAAGQALTVVGVCIPWFDAQWQDGRREAQRWELHGIWLEEFQKLRSTLPDERTVVLGDFNQRIPRQWAPKGVYEALMRTFEGFEIATEGNLEGAQGLAIDHIAHTPDLVSKRISIWPDRSADGKRLSDHFGVWGDFGLR